MMFRILALRFSLLVLFLIASPSVSLAWKRYLPSQVFPFRTNPSEGFLATANAENLPPRYPYAITYLWEPPYRYMRVEEMLKAGSDFTIDDIARLQTDELSIPARTLVPLLRGLRFTREDWLGH
jgi:penicillin amidase